MAGSGDDGLPCYGLNGHAGPPPGPHIPAEGLSGFGQTLELAGDALTPSELAAAFADHNGRPMLAQELPVEAFGEAVMPLFAFMRDTGWPEIDIDALRERFPRLHTVKGALEHSGYKPPES